MANSVQSCSCRDKIRLCVTCQCELTNERLFCVLWIRDIANRVKERVCRRSGVVRTSGVTRRDGICRVEIEGLGKRILCQHLHEYDGLRSMRTSGPRVSRDRE